MNKFDRKNPIFFRGDFLLKTYFTNKKSYHQQHFVDKRLPLERVGVSRFWGKFLLIDLWLTVMSSTYVRKYPVYVRRRLSGTLQSPILKQLYWPLVYPHLTYGIEAWGGAGKCLVDRLQDLQDRCFRSVFFMWMLG